MKRYVTLLAAPLVAAAVLLQPLSLKAAQEMDIVDTAVAAGSFKTLAAALGAADLAGALKGDGPFTVFAPTDAAFAKLPKGTVETLLKPENKEKLVGILTYHVAPGEAKAKDVVKLSGVKTLNGQRVEIKTSDAGVTLDSANVVKTDIVCSNGVIHVIDSVILPASDNLAMTAEKAGSFNTLLAAVNAAGLADAFTGEGPLTIFAPTDEAFAKLPEGTVQSLLKPENRQKLTDILTYHVVKGRVYSDDALAAQKAKTLQGGVVKISANNDGAKVNQANLVKTDIDASNGVIHVVDQVLIPQDDKLSAAESREMIEQAVSKGAKLYNAGEHQQAAEVFAHTVHKMAEHGAQMPTEVRSIVDHAVSSTSHMSCPTQRSVALRQALDKAHAKLASAE